MGMNEGRNQLLNEIITVRYYRGIEREGGRDTEAREREGKKNDCSIARKREGDNFTLNLYRLW